MVCEIGPAAEAALSFKIDTDAASRIVAYPVQEPRGSQPLCVGNISPPARIRGPRRKARPESAMIVAAPQGPRFS